MNFRSKIWPRQWAAIRSGDLDFLLDRCISTTEWRLLDIFDVFVLLRRMALWPWPFDLDIVSCTVLLMADLHTNFYYPMTIGYWVTSIEYLITFPLSETVSAHAPCHMTSNRGKNSPHFWNPWPQFAYSLCHFHGAMTKIKPCYRQKIAFSYYEGKKVYCACAVSCDLCIGGPQTTRNNFLTPNCLFTIQLLCSYDDD